MKKKDNVKEKILQTAFELFTSSSYNKVSTEEIAKKANVSKGGLFHHFDSKYTLARDSIIWFAESEFDKIFSSEDFKKFSCEEQLKKIIDTSLEIIVENIHFSRFILDVLKEAIDRDENKEIWIDFLQKYIQLIEEIYSKTGVKNPHMRALLLMSALDGFSLYYTYLIHSKEKVKMENVKKELYGIFINSK